MARILVVDDDHSIRLLLSEILRKGDHTVDTAQDGADANALMAKQRFDLVVTDLHMRQQGGIEVLKGAKEHDPFAEVLILTGHGTIPSAVKAMQLGAFEYLTKPIDIQEFRMKVRQALERRELRQQIARQKAELKAHQEMIERDLKLAEQVQQSLVPKPIKNDRFEVAIKYLPMIGVGGDFSDIFYDQEDEVYLTIVDVTGHGITAALLVNRICMEIRRLAREKMEPARILYQLNGFIFDSFKGTGMFLTMFTGVLRLSTGELRYAGSAHPAAILWRNQVQRFELLESQNPIIGFEKTGAERFTQNQTFIQPGDKFLLYTDGIIEIEDKQKTPLGIKGLLRLLHPAMQKDSYEAASSIMNGLKRYIHEAQRDDIYLIITALR